MKKRTNLYLLISLLIFVGVVGCTPTEPPASLLTATVEPTTPPQPTQEPIIEVVPPSAPAIEPAKEKDVDAGGKLAIQASVDGAERYEWSLTGAGEISSNTGVAIIYTAPKDGNDMAVLTVVAYNAGGESPSTSLIINVLAAETSPHLEFTFPKMDETLIPNKAIKCNGTYTLPSGLEPTNVYIWVLIKDNFGNYFLQNPPVDLKGDDFWEATHVQPGSGITQIVTVWVTEEGNAEFEGKVKRGEWAGFTSLPDGSEIVGRVDVTVP